MISRLVAQPFHGPHLLVALLVAFTVASCGDLGEESPLAPESAPEQVTAPAPLGMQDFGPAIAAADRYTAALMRNPNIVGTGVGLNEDGKPSVRLFLVTEYFEGLPDELDGVPVSTAVTGQFWARSVDRTARARPAPIGFSVGHPDITAGTLGARVTRGSSVFILSNNHVLADSNDGNKGDPALQPGDFDGGSEPDDIIGHLEEYYEIDFDGGDNTMDAAIAIVDGADVSGSTPDEGYGAPSTNPVDPTADMGVQKYGRTTGHTFGTVEEINVTVTVCFAGFPFCTKSATFVDQFTITPGDFSDGGDSGSLIVTEDGNHPVGLLFAGSDTRTIANQIKLVLDHFTIEIDHTDPGDSEDPDDPEPEGPTASFTYSCDELDCSFDGSGSTDGDTDITSYEWDFGDESTGSGETVSHTYQEGGTYTVTLTVTDEGGLNDSTSENVTVAEDEQDPEPGELSIDQWDVNTRSTGPWNRADVTWTVSHTGGGLASVTTELLVDGDAVDSQTSTVSGSEASGEHDLRVRNQTPTHVRITVTDVDENEKSETKEY